MTKSGGPCPICNERSRLTDEDIVPMWLRRLTLSQRLSNGDSPDTQAPRRLKIRVCSACNARLGRDFEQPAAPLISRLVLGEPRTLPLEDQLVITAWFAKTSLLGILKEMRPISAAHSLVATQVRHLMEDPQTPGLAYVRLFRAVQDGLPWLASAPHLLSDACKLGGRVAYYSVGWFGALGYEFLLGDKPVTDLARRVRDEPHGVFVYPGSLGGVHWPPVAPVTTQQLRALRDVHASQRDAWLPPPGDYDF